MKNLLLGIIAILFSFNGLAYNEIDVAKFRELNACEGCDLSGLSAVSSGKLNLQRAKLTGANLRGANLSNTNLRGADLRGADLTGADLTGANLSNANLKNTDFTTTNLKNAKLDGALYCKTKMLWGELNDDC